MIRVIERLVEQNKCSTEELVLLVQAEGEIQEALWKAADKVRRRVVGDTVHLRGLIEFSNHCERNCLYCGLRRDNHGLERYRMTPEQVVDAARHAAELGYKTIVLQSGEDSWYDADKVASMVRQIKVLDVAVTLSLGERPKEELALWRSVGADRYLLRHETVDPELYRRLHPGMSYEARFAMLEDLRSLGYQVGAGNMVGLPGQTPESLAGDLQFLAEFEVDMAGIGPFISNPATPLAGAESGRLDKAINVVALARLLMPKVLLPATTALGALDVQGRQNALRAGANVVMPNVTPIQYRAKYQLYPNKICIGERPQDCRRCIEGIIRSLGRTVGTDYGHSYRVLESEKTA